MKKKRKITKKNVSIKFENVIENENGEITKENINIQEYETDKLSDKIKEEDSKFSENSEEKKDKLEYGIGYKDIRYDNFDSQEDQVGIPIRPLTGTEYKQLKRLEKEDEKIYNMHNGLKEQEEVFVNEESTDFPLIRQPEQMTTKLLNFQLYGISWMINRENSLTKGGILADEMGMGKTLQTLGLILLSKENRFNLVVTPAISLYQWKTEIEKHTKNTFNVILYHGRFKKKEESSTEFQFSNEIPNIVLTTYGTVASDYRRKKGLLMAQHFDRVIIDEAHCIKDSKSLACAAVSFINSTYRWGLTGTPVQNRVGDLYSLIKFLKLDPHGYYYCKKCDCKSTKWLNFDKKRDLDIKPGFCTCGHFSSVHFSWWNRRITTQIKKYGFTELNTMIFKTLKKITSHIILRRTKMSLEQELKLPPKIVFINRNYFSEQEKDFYTSIYKKTKTEFMDYAIVGQVAKNYVHIFDLLQKMRLAANHPYLTLKNVNENVPICGFCNEEADDPILSKCQHVFCRKEAIEFLQSSNTCPICKIKITIDLNQFYEFKTKPTHIHLDNWKSSTKIECLVEELFKLKSNNTCTKSIVFSQFVNFLEMLRWRLERAGFRCVTIYGSMNLGQRKAAVESFNSNSDITIFLISLKAGGLALNLTEANYVFLMDLWWNPAVEEQAMDRIHRIGQHRPITIQRIIIEDSIESKILVLQKKKKALFDSSVEGDVTALNRLTEDDLHFLFAN